MSEPTLLSLSPALVRFQAGAVPRLAAEPFLVSVHRRLEEVQDAWRELERSGAVGIFQRLEVFEAWTRTVAHGQADWLVVAVRHRACGRPALLMPLASRQVNGLKLIEGADLEVSDFLAPAIAHDFRPSRIQMRAIWSRVLALLPSADAVRISKMPERIGDQPNPMLLLRGVEPFHLSNFRTRLTDGGVDWTERIPGKVKTELAARRRKLGKRGKLQFRVAETEAEAERYYETMVAQRAERCRVMGRDNILDRACYRDFYRALIRPGARESVGVMQALLVDDEIVATGYGLNAGSSFLMIFPTFASEKWRNYSPGLQLFMDSMRWAQDRGMTWYDFTIGGEGFKRDLAAGAEPLYEYLSARSLMGAPVVWEARARSWMRRSPMARAIVRRCRRMPG